MEGRRVLMEITRGKLNKAQKVVIYGPEGIGKSTFASLFPEPLFIDTEGSTSQLDVMRFPKPTSWTMLNEEIKQVIMNPSLCKTLVIDTTDWAETLCITEFCAKKQITGIEDMGYGKGYTYIAEEFGKMLNLLNEVIEKGIHVVLTAHAIMRKFEQPDELGAYDRWELKLQKKEVPLVKEWADLLLFANYKTFVINVDKQGALKGKNKVQGGQRVMYTTHHSCWDAKNRHGLADELPFEYGAIAHIFNHVAQPTITQPIPVPVQAPVQQNTVQQHQSEPAFDINQQYLHGIVDVEVKAAEPADRPQEDYTGIPQALIDLMKENEVTVKEIQTAVASKGYYPMDAPISNYDPNFIQGVLIGAWTQVFEMIKLDRSLPF